MAESSEQGIWPGRVHHAVPGWVKSGALFHVRLRVESFSSTQLTEPNLAQKLMATAQDYHERQRWHCHLILLMPDHVHALLSFSSDKSMETVVGSWKRYTARFHGARWQINFFDHRIRHERELAETWEYILRNPVAKNLCERPGDWPWVCRR